MTDDQIIEAAIQGHASTRDAIRWAIGQVRMQANTHQLPSVSEQNTHQTDDVVRQPLTEAQITFLHDMSRDGDYLDFARLIEAKHGIFEIAKVCPACGSEDVSIIKQTENNEVVAAADYCQVCHYQWNIG